MKEKILSYVEEAALAFAYYDRKKDTDLTLQDLREAMNDEVVTIGDMVERFRETLIKEFN